MLAELEAAFFFGPSEPAEQDEPSPEVGEIKAAARACRRGPNNYPYVVIMVYDGPMFSEVPSSLGVAARSCSSWFLL